MMSPSLTALPRLTRSSVSTPPVRAVTMTRLSASVRPEIVSLRLCCTTFAGHDRDAEQLLHLVLGWANGGAALGALVRQEMPGRDPEPSGGDEANGGDAAPFHRAFSLGTDCLGTDWGRLRSMWRMMSMKIGTTDSGSKPGSSARRHHTPVGDHHQHGDDAVEIDVPGNVAALGGGAQQVEAATS